MGRVIIAAGGGSGSGSDECTATRAELLKGYTAITNDSDDEMVVGTLELTGDAADSQVLEKKTYYNKDAKVKRTGTMQNVGAVSVSLNAGGSYTVPSGYHNGSGKVAANSLASQTPGSASAGHILSGQTAWVNGSKLTGNIPYQNADVSGTDRAWATNISCWEGVACLGVRNAHYLNGVNWIQGNISNFYAGNIKKGVNMGGLVGTFEGYIPTAKDLYLRGNNLAGWYKASGTSTMVIFDAGQISIGGSATYWMQIASANAINITGFNSLNIEGYTSYGSDAIKKIELLRTDNGMRLGQLNITGSGAGNYVYSFNVSTYQISATLRLDFFQMGGAIYRIWLS